MTKNGTIAFEDLWPSQGDYDMNDLVLTYQSTITFDKDNKAIKTEDIFTPINNGAGVDNAFGYQLDGVSATNLKSVSIDVMLFSDYSTVQRMDLQAKIVFIKAVISRLR